MPPSRYYCVLVLALLPCCLATVCSPGQIAIGKTTTTLTGPGGPIKVQQGFMMDNNCDIFAQPSHQGSIPVQALFGGSTMCGAYDGKASVQCDSSGIPTTATDTNGNTWSCHSTSDTGCNNDDHSVVACCDVSRHASRRRRLRYARQH